MTVPRRGIVREKNFEAQAAAIQPNVKRMDEAFTYLDAQLSADPRSGIESAVPGLWVALIRVPTDTGIARASVFYTFTDTHVHYQSIRVAP